MASNSQSILQNTGSRSAPAAQFQFERDTLCFANELVWQYQFDPATGRTSICWNSPGPSYSHRCFVMVRAARQFLYHAQFDASRAVADEAVYRDLIRQVVSRNPRQPCADENRIKIPGYDSLRKFSESWTALLKAECGQPWQCYFMRSHWRMVFPVWRGHQEAMSRQLLKSLEAHPPIVHIFRFPHVNINHGIVLFDARETERKIEFDGYDPNIPEGPVKLIYEREARSFFFPRTHYWAGGTVKVVEIYHNWCY